MQTWLFPPLFICKGAPLRFLTAFKEIADNGDRMSVWSRGHRIIQTQVVVLTQCQPWGPHPVPLRKGKPEPWGVLARRFGQYQSHPLAPQPPVPWSRAQTQLFPRSQGGAVSLLSPPDPVRLICECFICHSSWPWKKPAAGEGQIKLQGS